MINGNMLRLAMISGANNISIHRKPVDELNVFPVPDGDTGTNMSMTMQASATQLKALGENKPVAEISRLAASALLRGARGNSGVITSLLFRGFSKGLDGLEEMDGKDIAQAMTMGVEAAYGAVMKPTEGTMLTVARIAAEHAVEKAKDENDPVIIWDTIVKAARESLLTTPELLPALKKAGVVDAGGEGVCLIFEGMQKVFHGEKGFEFEEAQSRAASSSAPKSINAAGLVEADIKFAYCTEFIVNRSNTKDATKLQAFLKTIGDSLVVVDDEDIIKVHVHTNDPGAALQEGQKFGYLTNMKIDNMKVQHSHQVIEAVHSQEFEDYKPVDDSIEYGFVTVAAGDGIHSLFKDLGVDVVVNGGQTMNPSTDDILAAIHSVPAKTVIVLPNNKNIIMSAEQAQTLADREVIVLSTTTIPQGIAAMLAFDEELDKLELRSTMQQAANKVGTGQLTFAARDSDYDGKKINKGEILALVNGKISFVDTNIEKAAVKLVKELVSKNSDSEFVTVMYGEEVSEEQALEMQKILENKVGKNIELTMINGGQPVYYYIISVE